MYLDSCIDMICSRCSKNPKIHHNGIINTFLTTKKNSLHLLDAYFKDTEHGLFHGIMCGFIISLLHKDKNIGEKKCILEKEYISVFLHDILKCNGYSQEEHDKCLSEFYPNLKDETYTHSNPSETLQNEYLILADRIELMRYPDYKSWVDERHTKIFQTMEETTKCLIEQFYSKIRNVLLFFFSNSDSTFLRHGLEKLEESNFVKYAIFPPKGSYLELGNGYPIEIDRPPFGIVNNYNTNDTNGACSNHGLNNNWNKVKGYIRYTDFCNFGGKIIDSHERDHLYANSSIKLKDWVFMYQNINENNFQIVKLIENDINILPQKLINKLYTFVKLIKDRLIVLSSSYEKDFKLFNYDIKNIELDNNKIKCNRDECNYSIHTDINNNGGTHCCRACKNNGNHGLACEKIKITEEIKVI